MVKLRSSWFFTNPALFRKILFLLTELSNEFNEIIKDGCVLHQNSTIAHGMYHPQYFGRTSIQTVEVRE